MHIHDMAGSKWEMIVNFGLLQCIICYSFIQNEVNSLIAGSIWGCTECSENIWHIFQMKILMGSRFTVHSRTLTLITTHWSKCPVNLGRNCVLVFISAVNSLRPGDAYVRHWTGSSLVHVMACRLFAPIHYVNQWWLFFDWTIANKVQYN